MNKRIVLIILFIYLLGVIAVFSSCTSVKKLRSNVHQETVKTETVQKSDTKDSTSKTITKTIDSSGITVTVVYDSTENSDTETTLDIITYPAKSGDYESGFKIKSSIKPKSVQITSHNKKVDERQKDFSVKEKKEDAKVTSEKIKAKVKTVEKKKFKVPVTLMIIIIAAIIALIVAYKYRKPIRTFIIKLISPLKFLT